MPSIPTPAAAPRALLFTQCLQNDFVRPLGPEEPLPCDLHVGPTEALRLVGEDPEAGPLAAFLRGCGAADPAALALVHVRDWHDAEADHQAEHLAFFGPHCLAGSRGAAFVGPLEEIAARGTVIDAPVLSDYQETPLPEILDALAPRARRGEVRVGVIGVWTDVKVHYLLYDLKERGGFTELGVCSALTASRSRVDHFRALEHMRTNLGVRVFDSVAEFGEWLGVPAGALEGEAPPAGATAAGTTVAGTMAAGTMVAEPMAAGTMVAEPTAAGTLVAEPTAAGAPASGPRLLVAAGGEALSGDDARIVSALFRHCREVSLRPLAGGFSGARVLLTDSVDKDGCREAPCVVKLDERGRVAQERARFERVEHILGNHAPQLKGQVELATRAGLKFLFAGTGLRPLSTFQRLYRELEADAAGLAALDAALDAAIRGPLGRLYGTPLAERASLYRHYGFRPEYAAATLAQAASVPPVRGLPDPVKALRAFYEDLAAGRIPDPPREVATTWIHGDLNAANLLLDGGGCWLIDFFHAQRGPLLQDLAKLENDLKFILTPVNSEDELGLALAYERLLAGHVDLRTPLPRSPAP